MSKPILYLMLGYPGAGKTVTANIIASETGAFHLWADHERRKRYGTPTLSQNENKLLYNQLNKECRQLLLDGSSVIFDAAFNFYDDRERLRHIASESGADTRLLWISAPKEVARVRATSNADSQSSRVLGNMSTAHFEKISLKLEPPHKDESFIELDGTKISPNYVAEKLGL